MEKQDCVEGSKLFLSLRALIYFYFYSHIKRADLISSYCHRLKIENFRMSSKNNSLAFHWNDTSNLNQNLDCSHHLNDICTSEVIHYMIYWPRKRADLSIWGPKMLMLAWKICGYFFSPITGCPRETLFTLLSWASQYLPKDGENHLELS